MTEKQILMNKYTQMASNLFLAMFFAFFIITHGRTFLTTHRISLLAYIIMNSIFLVYALTRKPARQVDTSPLSWLFAVAGTLMPLLMMPGGSHDLHLGILLQTIGIIISIAAGISLNRALGMVAAHRGIKTGGLFRWIRHPLYFSYIVSMIGFMVNNFSIYNLVVFIIHIGFQIQRIKYEEQLLSNDNQYRAYMTAVRYRLIPYVY